MVCRHAVTSASVEDVDSRTKSFILDFFAAQVYWIGVGFRYGYHELRERHRHGKPWSVGLFGGLLWVAIFIFRNLYGWKATIGLLVIGGVGFILVLVVTRLFSPSASDKLISDLDSYDFAGWALGFLFLGLAGAWCHFLLFAPFGVLCALGVRTCGE